MADRPPKPKDTVATLAACRVGVKVMRYTEHPDPDFDILVATDSTPGPNERHFETVERLPGLSGPEAAYDAILTYARKRSIVKGRVSDIKMPWILFLAMAALIAGCRIGPSQPDSTKLVAAFVVPHPYASENPRIGGLAAEGYRPRA